MHEANRLYWKHCSEKYSRHFHTPSSVIEFGSFNINGSIREVFSCKDYTGLDWRPGPGVDVVSLAHEYDPGRTFDTVVSASMLEHDPHWRESIANMVSMMKTDGIIVLTWGAALNAPHCLHEAPDGEFHPLPAGRVIKLLESMGMHIHEFRYEKWFARECGLPSRHILNDGVGEVGLVAFTNEKYSSGDRKIDDLFPEDQE
jgi:hypothetical protein